MNKNYIFRILISALILIIGNLVLFYVFRLAGSQPDISQKYARQHTQIKNLPTDWKVCNNDEYGFELGYPPDWYVWWDVPPWRMHNCPSSLPLVFSLVPPDVYGNNSPKIEIHLESLSSKIYKGTIDESDSSVEDFLFNHPNLQSGSVVKETQIDGEKLKWFGNGRLWVYHNHSIYRFDTSNISPSLLEQILGTFKFIN